MDHQQKDETAVAYLATAMNTKLARARAKGRSGWDTPECTQQHLSNLLREHVEKGDPVDVANYCAFLAARGEGIAPRQCLAQPIAGYRISDPSDPELGFWFSETPCAEGYTSEPLYAVAAPAAGAPQGERQWICPTRTVADLVNNLLTMDQALPIYGAQYIEKDGRRRAIAVPPTVSRERVQDGRWIGQGEDLNAAVVWTRAEQPAAVAGPASRKVLLVATGETSDGAETYTRHDDAPPPLCDAECLYTAPAVPALEAPAAPAAPLTPDEARHAARSAELWNGPSDATSGSQYAMAGALAFAAKLAAAPQAPAAHSDDAAVDRFAAEMKAKLAAARAKGRGGWETCPPEVLSRMLREHIEKGDPRDVANFCMFLWCLGQPIAAAPAAPSAIATQVIENMLQLARIVNTAVEDWGESFEDGSMEVTFHKEEADAMEAILEFFDSLPDAPPEEGVIESGPLRAARVLRALAAPAAPAVDTAELGEWVATLEVDSEGGLDYETVPPCTLPPGCYRLYRAAQAKEGGEAA